VETATLDGGCVSAIMHGQWPSGVHSVALSLLNGQRASLAQDAHHFRHVVGFMTASELAVDGGLAQI
jgi:hypothetical protein